MEVTRDVILDLLPVYLAGEASTDTRTLIEAYLERDRELAQRIRRNSMEGLAKAGPAHLPPDLELRSLRRTRSLLGWLRWLFGLGIAFTAIGLALKIRFEQGRLRDIHLLVFDYPRELGAVLALGAACWIGYFGLRRRLRTRFH